MAAGRGDLQPGCIAHADRGSDYTSEELRCNIRELGMRQSMGRTGSCYDSASLMSDGYFGSLCGWFAAFPNR